MSDKTLKDKTIQIKGKAYAQVKDRVQWLDENEDGKYSIDTAYQYFPDQRMWVVKAILTVGECHYSGLAQEVESDDIKAVNNASALENCETSAIGRACAAFGLGIQESYASANEMNKQPRTMRYATEKQVDYMRSVAQKPSGLEEGEDLDNWIESILTIKPQQVPIFKVTDAINKIKEQGEAIDNSDLETDLTPDEAREALKAIKNEELPY